MGCRVWLTDLFIRLFSPIADWLSVSLQACSRPGHYSLGRETAPVVFDMSLLAWSPSASMAKALIKECPCVQNMGVMTSIANNLMQAHPGVSWLEITNTRIGEHGVSSGTNQ